MKTNDYRKMQQNLKKIQGNMSIIQDTKADKTVSVNKVRSRQKAVEREINRIKHPSMTKIARGEKTIGIVTIAIVAVTAIFSTSIFAITMSGNNSEELAMEENEVSITNTIQLENIDDLQYEDDNSGIDIIDDLENQVALDIEDDGPVESNENAIQLEEILLENLSVLKSKEYVEEVREVDFETKYTQNANLPLGEKIVTKPGKKGSQYVTAIKLYENNEFVSENILSAIEKEKAETEEVDIGTSRFLALNKAHIGDLLYLMEEYTLKSTPNTRSGDVYTILSSLEVRLDALYDEEWCKVTYNDEYEGYIETKYLTTGKVTPGILESNRKQKIKMTLDENIALNKSTDLNYDDFRNVLTGNYDDANNIIADNFEVFYNIDKQYNINGLFVASIAIHESAWGTSRIANDKKNLFGYGAYDSSPYSNSFTFDTYAEGIETVAKVLVKYYLNPEGTPIYEGGAAKGSYYNGNTIAAVNMKYASDTSWHKKVYYYMQYLYSRI